MGPLSWDLICKAVRAQDAADSALSRNKNGEISPTLLGVTLMFLTLGSWTTRCLIKGFTLSRGDIRLLFKALFKWGWLELKEGWRSWWQPRENKVPVRIVAMREQRETVGDSSRL